MLHSLEFVIDFEHEDVIFEDDVTVLVKQGLEIFNELIILADMLVSFKYQVLVEMILIIDRLFI